jgi:hypothetical protein
MKGPLGAGGGEGGRCVDLKFELAWHLVVQPQHALSEATPTLGVRLAYARSRLPLVERPHMVYVMQVVATCSRQAAVTKL